jgi:ABC-type lipoprotein release transport system permease subunit
MQLLSLAARNLGRNRVRTTITLAVISFCLSMMVLTINLQNGSYQELTRSAISQLAGHVVVQLDGYQDEPETTKLVDHATSVADAVKEALPGAVVTQRITLAGLLVSPTNSVGSGLIAIQPGPESRFNDIADKLVEGTWLDDDSRGILMGTRMAESLGLSVGDKLVYMGQPGEGDMVSRLFRIKGIFKTGAPQMDGFLALIPLSAAHDILGRTDTANLVAVHIMDADDTEWATAAARAALAQRTDLDVRSWVQALPEIYALIQIDRASSDVIMGVLGGIAAMVVLATVLMSVLERTREFGVLMAIGMKPRRLATMVLLEGLVLGLSGAALGLVGGSLLSIPLVNWGLDMSAALGGESYEAAGVAVSALIKGEWDPDRMLAYGAGAVVFTVAAALYPAWWVTHLTPVRAMRHS